MSADPRPTMHFAVAAPVPVDGNYVHQRCDANGALLVNSSGASAAVSRFSSGADVDSLVIKASAGQLLQIDALNANAAVRFLHIFDLAAVPANGTAPDYNPLPVTGGGAGVVAFFWGDSGLPMGTGIVVAVSTTRVTLTLAGADMWISGRFL